MPSSTRVTMMTSLLAFSLGCSACHPERPDGWTEESHGKDAEPNYPVVLAQDQVKRLDLVIDPADWQAMLDDMTEQYGALGTGGQKPPEPPNMRTTCTVEGSTCDADTPGGVRPGTCLLAEILFCAANEIIAACVDHQPGDACALPGPPGAPSGTCAAATAVTFCAIEAPDGGAPPGGAPPDGPPPMSSANDPIWVPCEVRFEGQTWWHVGIRFKGNSTLSFTWQSGQTKLPFKLDFDQFEDRYPSIEDQRFWGFKRLAFANNARDSSYLREKVAGDLFRESGVPAPQRAFFRVFVDSGDGPIYFGLYTAAEIPHRPMFVTQLGGTGGNLYKPDFGAASWQAGLSIDETSFAKKSNEAEADWSDVENAIAAVHASRDDAEAWRSQLEQYFDARGFLRWLAINTVIQDWDTYGNGAHNYYLYGDPAEGGRLRWIPWDHNESLKSAGGMMPPLPLDLSTVSDRWPLIRYLMDEPVYQECYWQSVRELTETVFERDAMRARLQAEHDLIAPYVVGAEGETAPNTVLPEADAFDAALDQLFEHVDERHDAVNSMVGW